MDYIIIFFKNLFSYILGGITSIVPSVSNSTVSVLPTLTSTGAVETTAIGADQENFILGTALTTLGGSVSSVAMDASLAYIEDVVPAQAYVESMDEPELREFIVKLEGLNIEEQPKVLQRTLDNKFPRV